MSTHNCKALYNLQYLFIQTLLEQNFQMNRSFRRAKYNSDIEPNLFLFTLVSISWIWESEGWIFLEVLTCG